jgi:hypothetical protein
MELFNLKPVCAGDLIKGTFSMAIQSVATAAKIERESEPQRHHVRLQVPAIIVIGMEKYMTDDISAGGFCIKAGRQVFEQGIQDLKIYFPFQNFAFHLQLKAKPVYYNQILNTVGFTFTEIDSRQLSLLNLVIKSSLSGEIANDGQIMEVLKQNDVPKVDLYPHNKWSRFVPLGLIVLAGVTGLILLAGSIYENTSIVKSYMAVIEADTYTVSAAGDGVYDSLLAVGAQKVTKGQELAVLKPQSSQPENISASAVTGEADTPPVITKDSIVIKSPCDCVVYKSFAKDGEFQAMGKPLFELLPLKTNSWVTASVRPDQSHRLRLLDDAYVQVAGENKFIEGHITQFLPPVFETDTIQVRIKTTDPIPPELVGQPAYVEFVIF